MTDIIYTHANCNDGLTAASPVRLPIAPLAAIARANWRPQTETAMTMSGDAAIISDYLGVARGTVSTWAAQGLSSRQADHAALKAGLHPLLIWGEAWNEAT